MDNDKTADYREVVENRVKAEAKALEATDKKKKPSQKDKKFSKFVQECLSGEANFLGDGLLWKELNRGKFIYNKSAGSWMVNKGPNWDFDVMNEAEASVEKIIPYYAAEITRCGQVMGKIAAEKNEDGQNKILERKIRYIRGRIARLRSPVGRNNCLEMAHKCDDSLAIKGDEIDKKLWLFPCDNGVIDLRLGELREGRAEDYLFKASRINFESIETPCPLWQKTLLEIFSENQGLVDFVQRVFGCAMVGQPIENYFIVLSGQGRNGKTLIVNVLSDVVGPMAGPIRSEMLLDQRISNSSGPTPDIMALRGLRFAFASETDEHCRISPSRVKWLTGSDELTGRLPHDKFEVNFRPSHTLFLLTNNKPHAPAQDFAFWERVLLIPFGLSFVNRKLGRENERRADLHLYDKLKTEYPGILAWLVRGCLRWQERGLDPPSIVKNAVADYRRSEDVLADFLNECCLIGEEYEAGATELYSRFEIWYEKNISKRIPKQRWFGKQMSLGFEKSKSGTFFYHGVGLLDD